MKTAVLLLAITGVGLLVACRSRSTDTTAHASGPAPVHEHEQDGEDDEVIEAALRATMDPAIAGFVLIGRGRASLAARTISVAGRLQVYVRDGSQYATWSQFPEAIRYEVRSPSGRLAMTEDLSMSVSDTVETYDEYSNEPANQVVGKNFASNEFSRLTGIVDGKPLIAGPGTYGVRAHYQGAVSNWLELAVQP